MADTPQNRGKRSPSYTASGTAGADGFPDAGSASSFDLGALVRVVLRQFWVVVMAVVALTGATVGFSLAQTPEYAASIKIIIGQGGKLTEDPVAQAGLRDVTDTMVVAVDTRPVAEDVIRELDLRKTPEDMLDDLSAKRIGATQFIEVTYRDTDPQRARLVVDTIGTVFSDQIAGVSPGSDSITASIWEPAEVPESPEDPDPIRNGVLALMVGLIVGVGLALLLDHLVVLGSRRKK